MAGYHRSGTDMDKVSLFFPQSFPNGGMNGLGGDNELGSYSWMSNGNDPADTLETPLNYPFNGPSLWANVAGGGAGLKGMGAGPADTPSIFDLMDQSGVPVPNGEPLTLPAGMDVSVMPDLTGDYGPVWNPSTGNGTQSPDLNIFGVPVPQALDFVKQLILSNRQADAQQKIIDMNMQRAAKGLPPLPAQYFQPTAGVNVGLTKSAQDGVMKIALIGAAIFAVTKLAKG